MKHERFHDPRLSPQQNKAVEMLRNGFSRAEIEDEMEIGSKHLAVLLNKARKRGVDVPMGKRGRRNSGQTGAQIEAIKGQLWSAGLKGFGSYAMIAERVGLTRGAVAKHIHDTKKRGAQ